MRRRTRSRTVVLTALALAMATTAMSRDAEPQRRADRATIVGRPQSEGPSVVVDLRTRLRPASRDILGVNHHYLGNGAGVWDAASDQPFPLVVKRMRRAGVSSVRFPGGTLANLYDWKRAIGAERGCQVNGRGVHAGEYHAVTRGLDFGPDEFMELLARVGAEPLIMVPFVTETPRHAADWVEYMNSPAHVPGNPHGGVDWADERAANGHPAPYRVRWWEIGNEQYHGGSRYWLSPRAARAMRQYAYGGRADIVGERAGKGCVHPSSGVPSDATADQRFTLLFPPVRAASVRVTVLGHLWRQVEDLATAAPTERVFEVDAEDGQLTFGDGVHGRIPGAGGTVKVSYRSVHDGFYEFARQMKEVDPSIRVCATWGTRVFTRMVGPETLDCLTTHSITKLGGRQGLGPARWSGPLEGHDWLMLGADDRRFGVSVTRSGLPASKPLLVTEFSAIDGDGEAFPGWSVSASHAVYMAVQYAAWLKQGIRLSTGDELTYAARRGVIGQPPTFTFTANAVLRQSLAPMFRAGGRVLAAEVLGNPVRRPPGFRRHYRGLEVAATRTPEGKIHLLVVNRLPLRAVTATIRLVGPRISARAGVRVARGRSFASWNRPGSAPRVTLRLRVRSVGAQAFRHTFPAASATVFRFTLERARRR